ncbi:MAG: hypothetical protein WEA80_08895 [Gemmatimonadaceae bacterium]
MQHASRFTANGKQRGLAALRARRALVAALTGLAAIGCTEIAGPRSVASVDVRVQTVVQAELSLLTDFTVDAEITNTGSATVLYDRWCNWRIEQLVNGSWAPAYTPVCAPEGREIYQLWIGERAVHRYPAHRSWRVGNGAQVVGTYRLRLSVSPARRARR